MQFLLLWLDHHITNALQAILVYYSVTRGVHQKIPSRSLLGKFGTYKEWRFWDNKIGRKLRYMPPKSLISCHFCCKYCKEKEHKRKIHCNLAKNVKITERFFFFFVKKRTMHRGVMHLPTFNKHSSSLLVYNFRGPKLYQQINLMLRTSYIRIPVIFQGAI